MLEHLATQAAGLQGLGRPAVPRMIAVVSHGDEATELPLLWQLCLTLVNFGYPVTVLDATTDESATNPGLEQLLDDAHWCDDAQPDAPAWLVLPSARGIRNLCQRDTSSFQKQCQLGALFSADGVAILYCKAESMITLVGDYPIEPLLAVSPERTSLLGSYSALKRLLINGKLKPTIVFMMRDQDVPPDGSLPSAVTGLSRCAKQFLDHEVTTIALTQQSVDAPVDGVMQRLALRLIERSMPLRPQYESAQSVDRAVHSDHFHFSARSH